MECDKGEYHRRVQAASRHCLGNLVLGEAAWANQVLVEYLFIASSLLAAVYFTRLRNDPTAERVLLQLFRTLRVTLTINCNKDINCVNGMAGTLLDKISSVSSFNPTVEKHF